jgi:superfamily II RNA helicase
VFDEVHCIGNREEGVFWEQALELIPCPFLALSATIGDPKRFGDWMQGLLDNRYEREVEMLKTEYDLAKCRLEANKSDKDAKKAFESAKKAMMEALDDIDTPSVADVAAAAGAEETKAKPKGKRKGAFYRNKYIDTSAPRSRKLNVIIHEDRHSDLQKYMYGQTN